MKRQSVRSGLLLVSLLLFPVTIYFFSPLVAFKSAAAGVVCGSLLVYSLEFLGAVFVGRAFCGWIMPCGGLQEACFAANKRRAPGGRLNWLKWFAWAPYVGLLALLFFRAGGIRAVEPLRETDHGVSMSEPRKFLIYYAVVGVMTFFGMIVARRAFCHYLCLMAPFMILGRKLRNLLRLPALQLARTSKACAGCGSCSRACPMSLDVAAMARSGRPESAECILCGSCADACPQGALRLSFGRRPTPAAARALVGEAPKST